MSIYEDVKIEFVWELKWGFDKVSVKIASTVYNRLKICCRYQYRYPHLMVIGQKIIIVRENHLVQAEYNTMNLTDLEQEKWKRDYGFPFLGKHLHQNRPFSSCLLPRCQNVSSIVRNHSMEINFTYRFIFMKIKLIFTWIVSHQESFWDRGKTQLGNGLLGSQNKIWKNVRES